jgi:MoxR-like ATPase
VDIQEFRDTYRRIVDEIQAVVIGQKRVVHLLLTSVLAEGNVLLTGVPGLGRTLVAETLGKVLGLKTSRLQFTPDLLPTDVTGTEVIDTLDGFHQHRFIKGPVFANMVLADEINRSPPRTQAALLEAMQEHQVTAAGHRYVLPKPFIVIATQNTIDTEGVYRLPEAQLDRFLMQIETKYPSVESELDILDATTSIYHRGVRQIANSATVIQMQEFAKAIPVTRTVKEYASNLVRASRWEKGNVAQAPALRPGRSRRHWWGGLRQTARDDRVAQYVRWGASPRAGQALLRAAKIIAIMHDRAYVTREDVVNVFAPVLAHRVIVDHRAGARGLTSQNVLDRLVAEVNEQTAPKPTSQRMKKLLLSMKP